MMAGEGSARVGEGGEGMGAKSLILLGEGSGECGEGTPRKLLKTLRRGLAKVAKDRTPLLRRGLKAPVSGHGAHA